MLWIIFLKTLKRLTVWLSSTANGTHSFKSIYQITTIRDRSWSSFPDYNFNGADHERSVLMKVVPADSVQHVFHRHQMWMQPSHIMGIHGSKEDFRGDKITRKNLHPEIILGKACSFRRPQKSECVLNIACLFYSNFYK